MNATHQSGRGERRQEHRAAVLEQRVHVRRGRRLGIASASAQQLLPEREAARAAADVTGRVERQGDALSRRLIRELRVLRTVRLLCEHFQQRHVELEARRELREQLMNLRSVNISNLLEEQKK